jgi:hypothetical protein
MFIRVMIHGEVAAVQRGHLGQLQPLSDGDEGRVCRSQRKVAVCGNELGHPHVIAGG